MRPGLAGAQVGHRPLNTGLRPETAACLGHRPRDRPCLRPAWNGTHWTRRGQQRRDGDGRLARACLDHPRAGGETAGTGRSRCLSRSAHREAQCHAGLSRWPGIAQPRTLRDQSSGSVVRERKRTPAAGQQDSGLNGDIMAAAHGIAPCWRLARDGTAPARRGQQLSGWGDRRPRDWRLVVGLDTK